MKKFNFLSVVFFLLIANANAQYIQVIDNKTAQDLIENTLVNSPCANVSNFLAKGDNSGSGQLSYGYFSAGTSNFPFANGIVLSTGPAISTQGPNGNLLSEGANSWPGDSDLNTALNVSSTTYNATSIEFDFVPLTSKLSFDYIFASEEYKGNAPCNYSDGFAFLLKVAGSTTPYQNLAVIPNTNIPVKVTTVHPEIVGACPAINETYFDTYNQTNAPINFNGQTVIMTAESAVIPGTKYHIKLAIQDDSDVQFDSAIFLGGGSFKVGIDIGNDQTIASNNPICAGGTKILTATQPGALGYKWYKNGIQIPNEFGATYQITDNTNLNVVTYKSEVTLGSSVCFVSGEIKIQFSDQPILKDVTLVQCDDNNDGITTFDLSKIIPEIKNNNQNISTLTFYESLTNAQNNISPIANPITYQNTITNNLFAKTTTAYGCVSYANVTLSVSNVVIANQTIKVCDIDAIQDGKTSFDFDLQITPKIVPTIASGLIVKYYNTKIDALNQTNQLSNVYTNVIASQQTVFGRIANGADCNGIIEIILNILPFSVTGFEDKTKYICPNKLLKLEVPAGYSYVWSNGNITDNFINVTAIGNYSVQTTSSNGCTILTKFEVKTSDIATFISVDINDFSESGNTVLINYSGTGNYEFSIDGDFFQDNNVFTNVEIGEYQPIIRDKKGCDDITSNKFFVLDYPKYFTPNGDNINDYWKIQNLEKLSNTTISVYDRFGKLLKQFSSISAGWDGTISGKQLPADDYWFELKLENGRIIKNHFALKR